MATKRRSSRTAGKRRQLITDDEAVKATCQHRRPCSDCPWSRKALPGWLGSGTKEQWVQEAHGEAIIECHTRKGAQCAGAATYRANVSKLVRNPLALKLEPDTVRVFATPAEFTAHHTVTPKRRLGLLLNAVLREKEEEQP